MRARFISRTSYDRAQAALEVVEGKVFELLRDRARGMLQELADGVLDLGRIGGVDEEAEPSAEERLGAAVVFAADHRQPARQRFEKHEAEAFAAARHHVEVGEVRSA